MKAKIIKIILAIIATIALLFTSIPLYETMQANKALNLTKDKMLTDFNHLYQHLQENYVNFYLWEKQSGKSWVDLKDSYLQRVENAKSPKEFYQIIEAYIGELQDSHTFLVAPPMFEYIINASHDVLIAIENESPAELKSYQYRAAPLFDDVVEQKYNIWKQLIDEDSAQSFVNTMVQGVHYYHEAMADNSVGYVFFNNFSQNFIEDDRDFIYEIWQTYSDYDNLVIDIRYNPGGSDLYWQQLIVPPLLNNARAGMSYHLMRDSNYTQGFLAETATQNFYPIAQLPTFIDLPERVSVDFGYYQVSETLLKPQNSVGFSGNIYLLVSESTGSAANGLASYAKSSGWATLVGQPTQGSGAGEEYIALPNSGLVIRTDFALELNDDGSINKETGVIPDIFVENADDALDTVIALVK